MDQSLFGDDEPDQASGPPGVEPPAPVADWQVDFLRKALDARGVADMSQRQALVEQAAGRSVASLRDLSSEEANAVLTVLGRTAPTEQAGSLWDSRDEDTWIDRL